MTGLLRALRLGAALWGRVEAGLMDRSRRLALVLCAACLMLISCAAQPTASAGAKLVYGLTLAPSGIDPHIDVSSELGIPLNSVYDTLVYRSGTGELRPMLAESWSVSADGREYTFFLRDGVLFHDGTPFDAAAVKRTLDRITDPDTGSRKAVSLLGPYSGSRVVDERTVVVELSEPFAPLLDSFSQVFLAPASPAALDKWGEEYQFHQVGTGPFAFKEYVPKDHLTLVRNEKYVPIPGTYERDGSPEVEQVEFRFLVEPAVRLPALEAGDADVVGEIPPQDAARIAAEESIDLMPVAIPGLPLVGFLNTQTAPTDDLRVRQALLLAVDRAEITRTVFGGYSPPATGPLSRNHPDYLETEAGALAPDPTGAVGLLEEAGWQMGSDGVRRKDGQTLTVRALVMTWGLVPQVSQLLQAQWRSVGVDLQLEEVTFTSALAAVEANDYGIIFWSEPGTDGDLLTSFFHSPPIGQRNWSQVNSPELDRLLDEARVETDQERRSSLYAQAQRYITAEALVIPIRDYVNLNGVRACVDDLSFDSRGWYPKLYDLSLASPCR